MPPAPMWLMVVMNAQMMMVVGEGSRSPMGRDAGHGSKLLVGFWESCSLGGSLQRHPHWAAHGLSVTSCLPNVKPAMMADAYGRGWRGRRGGAWMRGQVSLQLEEEDSTASLAGCPLVWIGWHGGGARSCSSLLRQ